MVDALLSVVFENLSSLVQQEIGLIWGVNEEMERLSSILSTIHAVLEDAVEKRLNGDDRAIKNWLRKLGGASHVLDDVLDEFAMEASRKKPKVCPSLICLNLDPRNALFRRRITKKMRKVVGRLDEIANERLKFQLREAIVERKSRLRESRQSGSVVTEPKVYGREEDKEKIVEFLVFGARYCEDVSVYPVVGIGGIGKTTLAQLVFNDERVVEHFELRVWVCVSKDFDAKTVMRAIIESSTVRACEALGLDPLQRRLREIFQGKKFLLVLDDVWNEDQEQWDRLKHVLDCGSTGSSILITTRLEKVALITGTTQMHRLFGLSDDDCWLLFKQRAFGEVRKEEPNFMKIGKEIVKKCKGVPLAAKALGGLMRFKSEESEWILVMQSELWNVLREESSVFPALKLSYLNLPMEQRRCFAFCAVFPKNYRIQRERIVRLWMANGFIFSTRQVRTEEIGEQIFDGLLWRSFFQDYKKDYLGNWSFKIHDLVHDLARFVMEDECHQSNIDLDSLTNLPMRVRYLSSTHSSQSSYVPNSKSLRTLVLLSKENQSFNLDFRLNFPSLRAFDAEHFKITHFSSLVASSKHLRYLNLSYSNFETLPESICNLQSLQTLDLTGCGRLKSLPKNLSRLTSLRHLNIFGCVQLSRMPRHIGRLTLLRTLSIFIVEGERGRRLEELEGLNLGGDIEIKGLEKVESHMCAKKANLAGKRNINKLSLCWGTKEEKFQGIAEQDQVLESLEPPSSLTVLEIKNFGGVCFPNWLSNGILENVSSITFTNCKNCSNLPALNKLPLLKHLYIHQTDLVRYVENGPRDGEPLGGFISLENLMIRNLPNLEMLSRVQDEGSEIFPCLSELYIIHCYKLSVLPYMPSLKKLEVWKSHKGLLSSISNLRGLTSLDMSKIDGVTSFPDRMLQSLYALKALRLAYFPELKQLPSDFLIRLEALEKLHIRCCDELECFPQGFFQAPSRLKSITIEHCSKFTSLSESFRNLTALQSLDLRGCPELEAFPSGLENLSSLRNLSMSGHCRPASQCSMPKMEVLPEALRCLPSVESMIVSDFPKLASLPEWLGNVASLQELYIGNCPSLVSIPTSIRQLGSLKNLSIETCPKLQQS